jgi:hypothetical protein
MVSYASEITLFCGSAPWGETLLCVPVIGLLTLAPGRIHQLPWKQKTEALVGFRLLKGFI